MTKLLLDVFDELRMVASCSNSLLNTLAKVTKREKVHFGDKDGLTCSINELLSLEPKQQKFIFFQKQSDNYVWSDNLADIDDKHHFAVVSTTASKDLGNKYVARICLH